MSTVSCVGVDVAGTSGVDDVRLGVAFDVGLVVAFDVVVVHAASNKIKINCKSIFIMRLYSLSEHGHSQRDHAHD